MKKLILVLAGLTIATSAFAADNVIAHRQKLMKEAGAAFGRNMGAMAKGKMPFDEAKVQASLDTLVHVAKTMPTLFPDDSMKGNKTRALPAIWKNKADFEGHFTKLAEVATAEKASIKDEASLRDGMKKIGAVCGACHKLYRAPDED